MKRLLFALSALAMASASAAAPKTLSPADRAAAFAAAGFKAKGNQFVRCDDTTTSSSQPGRIEATDLNGDGRPEAWITESSLFCYGHTAEAFVLVTKGADGRWTKLLDQIGVALALTTKRMGWPDIEVGGPGPGPFPIYRFDGKKYVHG